MNRKLEAGMQPEHEKVLRMNKDKSEKILLKASRQEDKLLAEIENIEHFLKNHSYDLANIKTDVKNSNEYRKFDRKIDFNTSFDEIVEEAERYLVENQVSSELFSEAEIYFIEKELKNHYDEFEKIIKLDKWDWCIAGVAGTIGAVIDCMFIGIQQPGRFGGTAEEGGVINNFVNDKFGDIFAPSKISELERSFKVPYDAPHSQNLAEKVAGLGPRSHRFQSLGHDPILGFFFGVRDIMNGTMSATDKYGKFIVQNIGDETPIIGLLEALVIQIGHLLSDVATKQGLPAPLMPLLQFIPQDVEIFGKSIAKVSREMYEAGYDFRAFISQSVSVFVIDLLVRILYFVKRHYKDGFSFAESVPVELSGKFKPKLQTMLFTAHTIGITANAVKSHFGGPMQINAAQAMAFFRYGISQLYWLGYAKENERQKHVQGKLDIEENKIMAELNELWNRSVLM